MTTTEAPSTITRTVDGVEIPIAGTYQIDGSHTEVTVIARHLVFTKVRARFPQVTGTVTVGEDPAASAATVEIDVASLDSHDAGRDEHLRSADFFDVESYPSIAFKSTGIRRDRDKWALDGDLTIRDTTKGVTLAVEYLGAIGDPWGGQRVAFTAAAELDRGDWGLTWNMALETGGVVVSKLITIEIDTELVYQG